MKIFLTKTAFLHNLTMSTKSASYIYIFKPSIVLRLPYIIKHFMTVTLTYCVLNFGHFVDKVFTLKTEL